MYMLQKVLLITGGYHHLHSCYLKKRFGARVKNYKNYNPYPQKLTKLYYIVNFQLNFLSVSQKKKFLS